MFHAEMVRCCRMFDRWHQQQSAMNYLQQTKPDWIQSSLPANLAGAIVPVVPTAQAPTQAFAAQPLTQPLVQPVMLAQPLQPPLQYVQGAPVMAPSGVMSSVLPSPFVNSLMQQPTSH
eukprot:Gregarina_sp_Pseudo_9__430@NODE_127_length_4112_cov_20_272772_g119_i0_p8_GENE_NODE_127_length_4112_cov_20_272772_g119_i0NODE_127_length_4112_cov_20_272772_g119_i0_p8_ORF_typecomplete_len118_score28_10_NODE_127_length_4112_cov_20_272772_g119_i017752128